MRQWNRTPIPLQAKNEMNVPYLAEHSVVPDSRPQCDPSEQALEAPVPLVAQLKL
jgi:hypothetical protein